VTHQKIIHRKRNHRRRKPRAVKQKYQAWMKFAQQRHPDSRKQRDQSCAIESVGVGVFAIFTIQVAQIEKTATNDQVVADEHAHRRAHQAGVADEPGLIHIQQLPRKDENADGAGD